MRKEKSRYVVIKNDRISAKRQSIKPFTFILVFVVALALFSSSVLAIKQLISLQGKVDFSGVLVDNGNLTVQI